MEVSEMSRSIKRIVLLAEPLDGMFYPEYCSKTIGNTGMKLSGLKPSGIQCSRQFGGCITTV